MNDTVRSFEASTSACSWKASLVRKIIFSRTQELRGKTLYKSVTSWPSGSQAKEDSFPMDFCLSCLTVCFPALVHHQPCPSFVPAAPGREHCVRGQGSTAVCAAISCPQFAQDLSELDSLRPLPFCKMELKLRGKSKQMTGKHSYDTIICWNLVSPRNSVLFSSQYF